MSSAISRIAAALATCEIQARHLRYYLGRAKTRASLPAKAGNGAHLAKERMEFEAKFSTTARRSISSGRSASEERSTARSNPMILSVDDEPDNLTVLRLFLSAGGFDVIGASDAAEALQLIEAHCPDLIITDFTMPGMSGVEFCRILRGRREARDIPIILYSGTDLREADRSLFDRVVLKPAELDVFARAIRDLLSIAAGKSTRLIPGRGPLPTGP